MFVVPPSDGKFVRQPSRRANYELPPEDGTTNGSMLTPDETSVLARVDELAEEMTDWLREFVRIPTVNPPGENYGDAAQLIGHKLKQFGYEINYY